QKNWPPEDRIAEGVWERAERAAGGPTDYNPDLPKNERSSRLSVEGEELLSSWFAHELTFWAFDAVHDLIREDPERLWMITKPFVPAAPDEEALGYIGAGPLEDLLSDYGEHFIERVEQQAATDAKFRYCLAGVWQSEMSD